MQTTFKEGEILDLNKVPYASSIMINDKLVNHGTVEFNQGNIDFHTEQDSSVFINAKKVIINGSKTNPVIFTDKIEINITK